jgi:hypothetical protein
MSSVNSGGLTVPDDSDPVAQGAAAMRTIASKIGAMATGTASISIPTAQTVSSVAVTFPAGRFTAIPAVVVNRSTLIGWGSMPIQYWAAGATTTGFTLNALSAATGGAASVQWIAVQAP